MIEYYPNLIESTIELYLYIRMVLNQRACSEVFPPLDLSKFALAQGFRIEQYRDSYYFCVPFGMTVDDRIKEKLQQHSSPYELAFQKEIDTKMIDEYGNQMI